MKTQYDVKLLNGSKQEVTYEGIETVTLPAADGSGVKKFTAGEPIDRMGIKPDFTDGDMPFESPEGYVVRSATVLKPEDAEGKIAKGETLMGMTGEYVTPGTSKTVELDFSDAGDGETVILKWSGTSIDSDGQYVFTTSSVYSTMPVVVGKAYQIEFDGTAYECVAQDASELMTVEAVVLGNASVFGLLDNDEPFVVMFFIESGQYRDAALCLNDTAPTSHTISITQGSPAAQTVTAEGDERWNEVVISKPENLTPENIAKGVEIAGVVGESVGIGELICGTVSYIEDSSIEKLRNYCFYQYASLSAVSFPRCTSIGTYAFCYCANLSKVTASDVLAYVGSYAFTNTKFLNAQLSSGGVAYLNNAVLQVSSGNTSVILSNSATMFADGAFSLCSSRLTYVSGNGIKILRTGQFSSYSYLTSVVFPDCSIIEPYAFYSCSRFISVCAPKVLSIGDYAFSNNQAMLNAEFPVCSYIGAAAFQDAKKLSYAYFPECKTIGGAAFRNCYSLTDAVFPDDIDIIGANAFGGAGLYAGLEEDNVYYMNNVALSVVSLAGSIVLRSGTTRLANNFCSGNPTNQFAIYGAEVLKIPNYAFFSCKSMTSISFPTCVSIGYAAFYTCSLITMASFPRCEYVGTSAFMSCSRLITAYLPVCSYIGVNAFRNCSYLSSVYLLSTTVPGLGNYSAFYSTRIGSKTGYIYVRESLVSKFQASYGWSNYAYVGLTDAQIEELEATT